MAHDRETLGAGSPSVLIDARKVADSGIGTYIRNIAPRVIRQSPEIEFRLLGPEQEMELLADGLENCHALACGVKPLSLREQVLLPRYIPSGTRLFWAPHFNIPLVYSGALLVTVHDIMPAAAGRLSGGAHHNIYVRAMLAAIRAKSANVISVSEFTASELVRIGKIDRRSIEVIHEAAHEKWFSVRPVIRPHMKPYLLYVGLVKPHKNLLGLMKGFGVLWERRPHDLIIVGDRERIRTRDDASVEFAARFGSRVLFTGRVSDEMLEQYVAHADALVIPSLYEGFGLPALEAMACGCPVVASRAASLPEVCAGAAILFDPLSPSDLAQAVESCIGDPDRRTAMIRKGREQAAKYSWDRAAHETSALIRRIIGTGNAAQRESEAVGA